MSKSTDSISKGIETVSKNRILFIPLLAPLFVQLNFIILAYIVFSDPWLVWGGNLIALFVGFVASCMIVDMAYDITSQKLIDLNKSLNAVTSRIGTIVPAALIATVCAVTIGLTPIAFFIVTIVVIENLGAFESARRAFDFVVTNRREMVTFLFIVLVPSVIFVFGLILIPTIGAYIGSIILWPLTVIFAVASVHFYVALGQKIPPSPPPPVDMEIVCPNCGYRKNYREFSFCGRCGAALKEGETEIY
jgi:hypothetical protein